MEYIYLFIISMLPLVELRGAIIYALLIKMNILLASIICIFANTIIVPFIFIFARKTLYFFREKKYTKKIAEFILKRGHKASLKLKNKKFVYFALFLFVGIPLPGTGVWTGSLASSLLELDLKKSFIAMFLGCILATILMLGFKIII